MQVKTLNTILLFFVSAFGSLQMQAQTLQEKVEALKTEEKKNDKEHLKLRKEIADLNEQLLEDKFIDTTQTIIYNFQTKKYVKTNVNPVVGEPIVFKIININRLAYEVQIKSEDVAIADENFKPEIETAAVASATAGQIAVLTDAKDVTKPQITSESLKEELRDKVKIDIKGTTDIKKKIEVSKKNISKFTTEIKLSEHELATLMADSTIIDSIKIKEINLKNTKINNIQAKKEMESAAIDNNYKLLSIAEQTVDSINSTFNDLSKRYSDLLAAANNLNEIANGYETFRSFALNPTLTHARYIQKKKDEKGDFFTDKCGEYGNQVKKFEAQLTDFNAAYNRAVNAWMILDRLEPAAKENVLIKYQLLKGGTDKIQEIYQKMDLKKNLIKCKAIDEVLNNENAYVMASSPIQPFEDYVNFDIKIKHRDDSSEYNDDREFKYMEYTKGGVRFDFSTGAVFDFQLDKNDRDDDDYYDEYEIVDVTQANGDIKKQIVGVSRNVFMPSLAGMFHMSFRRSGNWALGLTLGASINVETFELNSLFPGVSVLIGKKQKFILTVGPSFKQMDILKKNYSLNELYDSDKFGTGTELTSKQFKIGLFFGISYNLTQKQRGKFKINSN